MIYRMLERIGLEIGEIIYWVLHEVYDFEHPTIFDGR